MGGSRSQPRFFHAAPAPSGPLHSINLQYRKSGNSLPSELEVIGIYLQADAAQPQSLSGCNYRSGAHEWIQQKSLAQGESCTHDLPQKTLGLQRRVWSNPSLISPRWRRINKILKGLSV